MVSSQTLKRFVKMHEDKLNAKTHGMQTARLDAELDEIHGQVTGMQGSSSRDEHWRTSQFDRSIRHRPKSRYFNFILTSNHS